MSDDGADFGIKPERALKTILGGEPSPERDEGMSPEKMRAYLESAPDNPDTYDDSARAAGKIVLAYLEMHPEDARLPADSEYRYPRVDDMSSREAQDAAIAQRELIALGIYEALRHKEPGAGEKLAALDITGFMWGWAVNAAKYALNLPPVPNPAIVTVGSKANQEPTDG